MFGFSLTCFLFLLGAILIDKEKTALWMPENGSGDIFLSEIVSAPEERKSSMKCLVTLQKVDQKNAFSVNETEAFLYLYLPKDSISLNLQAGDVLAFPDNLFRDSKLNPGEFDYAEYLRKKGISGSLYLPSGKWMKVGSDEHFSLNACAMNVQRALLDKLRKYDFPKDEFAVLSAMVLGNREFMDKDIKNSYANTGASHILAVSGLHVGVVFFVLSFVLSLFWKERHARWLRTVVLLLALWSYAFITGLPSSVVRASVMLSFVCLGMALNRKSSIYNTMAASAFFMLLYHPFYLFDVSFQLSYMAVWSIVAFQPKIYAMFSFKRWLPQKLWSLLSVSLAAQIGTVPISLYYFHQFANYFWLSGFVVVPLSAVVIYLAIFLFALPPIPYLCDFVAVVLNVVLWVMNQSIYWIERFPLATIYNIRFGMVDVAFVFLIVTLLYMSLSVTTVRNLRALMLSVMLYFAFLFCEKWERFDYEYFAVYNIKNASVVNRFGKGENFLLTDAPVAEVSSHVSNFWMDKAASLPQTSKCETFEIESCRIFCLKSNDLKNKEVYGKLNVDVLVLGRDVDFTLDELNNYFNFKQIVLDSSNSWKYRKRMKKACLAANVKFYDVVESGAFLIER